MSASSGYGAGGIVPPGPSIDTLTGNTGGPVGPTANNINILGAGGVNVAGNPGTSTLTITVSGVATLYTEDTGTAAPLAGNLNVLGGASTAGTNMHTVGSGNTIDIILNDSLFFPNTNGSGTQGVLFWGGNRFVHNFGIGNTFIGSLAGNLTLTPTPGGNTGIGQNALEGLTTGDTNSAIGHGAGEGVTTGTDNIFIGGQTAVFLTTGNANTIVGTNVAQNFPTNGLITGNYNVLIGSGNEVVLQTAINYAGAESSNILIRNEGIVGESNKLKIGTDGSGDGEQNSCQIAGIYNRAFGSPSGVVQIDSTFKLGSSAGTNGQLLIGGTGVSPAWANLTSVGGSVVITNGSNTINLEATGTGAGASAFPTDLGTANEAAGVLNIFSGATSAFNNINTTGSGNTVHVRLNDSLQLPNTNASGTTGLYSLGGNPFMHNLGSGNTFLGEDAGSLALTPASALNNVGVGSFVLESLTTGVSNTVIGNQAGTDLNTGDRNVIIGRLAGSITSGTDNVIVGALAGSNYTSTESFNITIGSDVIGTTGESNTIRIGTQGQQTSAFMAGVYGATIGATNQAVFIDNTGKLGAGSANASNGLSLFYYVPANETTSGSGTPYTYFVGTSQVMTQLYDLFQPIFPGSFFPGDGTGTQASFTAPVNGIYQINWTSQITMGGGTFINGYQINIRLNGSTLFQQQRDDPGTVSGFPTGGTLTAFPAIQLTAGDVVDFAVVINKGGGTVFIAGLSQVPTGYKSYVNIVLIRETT